MNLPPFQIKAQDVLPRRVQQVALLAAVIGVLALAAGTFLDPARGFRSLLFNGFFVLTLALGGAVFVALMSVANAGWHTVLKRIPETMAATLPVGAAAMVAMLPGLSRTWAWAMPGGDRDPLIRAKQAFLNGPGFAIRMAVLLAIWAVFTVLMLRASHRQDADRDDRHTRRHVALSAGFLVAFAPSFCLASFDWLMSLEPRWFSTIFGLYNVAGLLSSTVAVIVLFTLALRKTGALPLVTDHHLHDLGKLLFGFCTVWAYLWLSQFLLIWYSNLPEETPYFLARWHHGWQPIFYANLLLNWAVPFVLLLRREAKHSARMLITVAVIVLVGRWIDLVQMVQPSMERGPVLGWMELAGTLGLGGLFVWSFARAGARVQLVAEGDPYLVESLHHHG